MRGYLHTGVSVLHPSAIQGVFPDIGHSQTDALRRHQKSRWAPRYEFFIQGPNLPTAHPSHNGVIIEPDNRTGPQRTGEVNVGETSRSRSCTPGSKNKVHLPPAVASPPGALPGYYRQQGINAGDTVT